MFACFVEYERAFDKVDRLQLWIKLLNSNISGEIFNEVHSVYSLLQVNLVGFFNSELFNTFPTQVGVRQGDRVSPLLFAIYRPTF